MRVQVAVRHKGERRWIGLVVDEGQDVIEDCLGPWVGDGSEKAGEFANRLAGEVTAMIEASKKEGQ